MGLVPVLRPVWLLQPLPEERPRCKMTPHSSGQTGPMADRLARYYAGFLSVETIVASHEDDAASLARRTACVKQVLTVLEFMWPCRLLHAGI